MTHYYGDVLRYSLLRPLLLLVLLLGGTALSAQAQGKIAGRVTDAASGESLIGVNVLLEGTQQGTVTDADGNYIIVNVRPGTYTLVFSYIGFQTQRMTDVRSTTGQTTRVDLEMREQVIEGEEIIVRAERPLVQKDLTASKKTVIAEDIDKLPVESLFGVLATQAGVTQGASGELHIRGGRSNEIAYLVDGMSVSNPFNTNGITTSVATDAIQEMTVISGAFNAEYGKAMSGIVNLVTKEGGDDYEGSVSFYGGDNITGNDDIFFTPSGVGLNVYTAEGSISGPVPFFKKMHFFLSGRRDKDEGYIYGVREHLPSDSANFNQGLYYEIQGRPWWDYVDPETNVVLSDGTVVQGGGLPIPTELVPMNSSEGTNVLAKLSIRPFRSTKLEYSFLLDNDQRTPFVFAYRYNPDGTATERRNNMNHSLHWTHTLDQRTFYTLRASYAVSSYKDYVYEDPLDPRYVVDRGETGDGNVIGFPGNNFLFGGNQKSHVYEDSRSIRTKFDFTRQFGLIHEVRTGIDLQLHSLDRDNFVVLYDGNRYRQPTVEDVDNPAHDQYESQKIVEFSAYAQDKLEFDNFIINAGLRYERFDPNGQYIPDLLDPKGTLQDAETTNLVLPRLGVSFPITERGIIHFSYGHFAQMPSLRNLYLNPEFEFPVGSIPTFGNTNMRPERTVQYEMGIQQQLGDQLAIDVTGYFKDIRDYLALQQVRYSTIAGEDTYNIYLNKAYANVKGVAISLTKRRAPGGLLTATLDYTFQVAEGNDDDSDALFFNFLSGRENELEIVPLDFDQRHILSSTVTISKPSNWGVSLIGQFSTGYPYSPLIFDQNLDLNANTGRKPSQIKLDAHLYKEFEIASFQLRAFAKIFNVLDRLNERFVFDDTGRATYSLSAERNLHATWEPNYGRPGIHTLSEYDTRPNYYSPPRQIRLGLTLAF